MEKRLYLSLMPRIKKPKIVRVTAPILEAGAKELVRRAQKNGTSAGAELAAIANPILTKR